MNGNRMRTWTLGLLALSSAAWIASAAAAPAEDPGAAKLAASDEALAAALAGEDPWDAELDLDFAHGPGGGLHGGMGPMGPGAGMHGGMGPMGPGAGLHGGMGPMGHGAGGGMHGGPAAHAHALLRSLDLTSAQRGKIEDLLDRQRRADIESRKNLELAELDLRKLVRADKPDRAAIAAQIDRASGVRAGVQKSRTMTHLDIADVLTPAQREKLRAMHERGPGGPGPGHDVPDAHGPGASPEH